MEVLITCLIVQICLTHIYVTVSFISSVIINNNPSLGKFDFYLQKSHPLILYVIISTKLN